MWCLVCYVGVTSLIFVFLYDFKHFLTLLARLYMTLSCYSQTSYSLMGKLRQQMC